MLTSDLLLARNIKNKIYPSYLKEKDKDKYLKIIQTCINLFENHIGLSLDELDESINSIYNASINRKIMDGFIKLLKDRCEVSIQSDIEPEKLREELFLLSTKTWENLSVKDVFNREIVIDEVSKKLNLSKEQIENQLFADLKGSQIINKFEPIPPQELFNRYNLSLAQTVLFKATRVLITIKSATPKQLRELFRYIKFFRLIYDVSMNENDEYTIKLDGPFSLFQSVQKYGVNMASFLPALMLIDKWELKADLLWGKSKQPATLELNNKTGLISHYKIGNLENLEEVDIFIKQFNEIETDWTISTDTDIINLKGEGICIPDCVFQHKQTGDKIFMEVFGYWSRESVWKRIELLEKNFPYKLIIAISKKLRVSEKAIKEDLPAMAYVYNSVILPKQIMKILDSLNSK